MALNRSEVELFFQHLTFQASAALEIQQQLDRYLASEVNLLDLFWVGENQFSNLLARLLNPRDGPGQGTLFLELWEKVVDSLTNIDPRQAIAEARRRQIVRDWKLN